MATALDVNVKVNVEGASALGDVDRQLSDIGGSLTRNVTLPIVAVGAAVVALASGSEDATARLSAAFESMGASAWTSMDELQSKATELMSTTTFDDEAIMGVQQRLLTFGEVTGEQFDAATLAALDMSAAWGTDVNSAAIMLGKALNDPIAGLTALSKSGVQFTDTQKLMILGHGRGGGHGRGTDSDPGRTRETVRGDGGDDGGDLVGPDETGI